MDTLDALKTFAINAVASGSALGLAAFMAKDWFTSRIRESIRHEYNAELERIRTDNQRHLTVFTYQLDALRALNRLLAELEPRRTHPDMDWEEAMQRFSFEKVAVKLAEFLAIHGPFLSVEARDNVARAESGCEDARFENTSDPQTMRVAEEVIELVRRAYGDFAAGFAIPDRPHPR